jgi:hypothetical protein
LVYLDDIIDHSGNRAAKISEEPKMIYKEGLLVINDEQVEVTADSIGQKIAGHDVAQILSDTEQARLNCPADHLGRVKRDRLSDGLVILRLHVERKTV